MQAYINVMTDEDIYDVHVYAYRATTFLHKAADLINF